MRERTNKLTAVRFTWGSAGPDRTFVYVFGNYGKERLAKFMGLNPRLFDLPQPVHCNAIATWRTKGRFFKWLRQRRNKMYEWTFVGSLVD